MSIGPRLRRALTVGALAIYVRTTMCTGDSETENEMANERATKLFDEFIGLTREFAVRNKLTPDEYHSVLSFLISLGETREWPLFLDAFFESTIDAVNYGAGEWTS